MSVELLAPAGDFQTALAAFEAGADAVYCGLADFSARAFATNLTFEELEQLLAYARGGRNAEGDSERRDKSVASPIADATNGGEALLPRRKRVYVTFNTLLDEDQFEGAIETLAKLEEIGPDGVIVQDLGVAKLIREHFPRLALHASTQLVAHNLEGVLALKELGFVRVVLARELSLEEISSIAKRCGGLELEVFIHGALCYSLSGLCLFGAMEKGRSGNRGKCPYCCRMGYEGKVQGQGEGERRKELFYPFSMRDLRVGEDVKKLVEAGVVSLKIEGRMKSLLYVASVTRYYRQFLDGAVTLPRREGTPGTKVTPADLETVFSRRTTELYLHGRPLSTFSTSTRPDTPIDSESLGHLGTPIGVVKKVTRDREGLFWLRFHTSRGLEKHDGLQFDAVDEDGKHLGMAVHEMRQAISRRPVFEVNAGVDVEIQITEEMDRALKPGMKIYCSMSNAVKRMFPAPSFRPSDYEGLRTVDLRVRLTGSGIEVFVPARQECLAPDADRAQRGRDTLVASLRISLTAAKDPTKTPDAIRKAFAKLGGTGYRLGEVTVEDPEKLFAPMSVLNDLRRDLVEKLDAARDRELSAKIEAVKDEEVEVISGRRDRSVASPMCATGARHSCLAGNEESLQPPRRVKIRAGQALPAGDFDEVIIAINPTTQTEDLNPFHSSTSTQNFNFPPRLALPVYTDEPSFNKLRSLVKRLVREGYEKWECADLATLRLLKQVGVTDITADWTLYAFNARALAELSAAGVKRFVASPENSRENLQYLAESGYDVEFLEQQSTPLFISLTRPEVPGVTSRRGSGAAVLGSGAVTAPRREVTAGTLSVGNLAVYPRDGLWVTTKPVPRTFDLPKGVATRLDLSWDPPSPEISAD